LRISQFWQTHILSTKNEPQNNTNRNVDEGQNNKTTPTAMSIAAQERVFNNNEGVKDEEQVRNYLFSFIA